MGASHQLSTGQHSSGVRMNPIQSNRPVVPEGVAPCESVTAGKDGTDTTKTSRDPPALVAEQDDNASLSSRFSVLSGERVSQMSRTFHDIGALTKLLEEVSRHDCWSKFCVEKLYL